MNRETKRKQPERIRRNYSRTLEEIADEFRFSDDVLRSDREIDDRHLIDDLSIADEDDGEPKVEKGRSN